MYLMFSTSQSGQSGIIDRLTLSECMSEIPGALMLRLARRLRDSFGSICTVCIIEVYCFMQIETESELIEAYGCGGIRRACRVAWPLSR